MGFQQTPGQFTTAGSQLNDLDQNVRGIPIQCIARVKRNNNFKNNDIEIQGNSIGLKDANNRIRDQFDVSDVFDGEQTNAQIYQKSFPSYVRAVLEGVNVSIFNYGATGSGKTHTMEGKNDEKGLVYLMTQQIFKMLEEKRYTNPTYHFEARIRFLEIFDETVHDLLQPGAGMAYNKNNVKIQEWEGNSVQGVSWIPVSTHTQLNDFFLSGTQNKNKRSNEFGLMADKSS